MVKIIDIIEAFEFTLISNMDPVITPYFDKEKQEVVYISVEDLDDLDEEQFIFIYSDIYSSTIIESFILTFKDRIIQEKMYDLFRGRGKYSRIKNYFYTLGVENDYYEFTNGFIKEKAIEWCNENNIEFEL